MTMLLPLTDRSAFERFKESHPELGSALKIAAVPVAEFVQTYAPELADGERQAYRIHQTAVRIQQQAALVWANLKDAASPFLQQTLFNNLPPAFLEQQQQIPGYNRLFGSLDFIECDETRSVLSPAAYFVDLMRFVEETITTPNAIPAECQLDQRRPDLFTLTLDDGNTHELIPYIDLVNQVLETLVTTADQPNAEAILATTVFPQSLPLNLPLAEIRAYLSQIDWDLPRLYDTFDAGETGSSTASQRERLTLSPQEFELLETTLVEQPQRLAAVYGYANLDAAVADLAQVDSFLQRTDLTRQQLNDLIYQDLDRFEVNAGLSRLFFINAVEDGLGALTIVAGPGDPQNPTRPPAETLINLSAAKLDRIYRFLKLARRLDWSYADLDWALRSLTVPYTPELVPQLDGLNDYVQVPAQLGTDGDIQPQLGLATLGDQFTLEAWVNPSRHQANPILCRGREDSLDIHFLLCLTATGRVAFYGAADQNDGITSLQTLPPGEFTHVAVTVQPAGNQSQVTIYLNGELDRSGTLAAVQPPAAALELNIGRNLSDLTFAGLIQEVRIWATVRSQPALADGRYRRFTGFEPDLAGYWPLTAAPGAELPDRTPAAQHGIPGGNRFVTQPRWASADLVLEPLPEPIGAGGYQFNGVDHRLAARGVTGLEADQFTLEARIQLDQAGHNPILSKGNAGNRQSQFLLWVDEQNRLVFRSTGFGAQEFRSQTPLELQTITPVAVTVSASDIRLYLAGRLDQRYDRPANTATIDPRGDDLAIGGDFSRNFFHGLIQEVRLWNYARTAEEINAFLPRRVPALSPGLIGYWPLIEITPELPGEQAVDLSVNRNPLYLGGLPADFRPTPMTVPPLLPDLPVAVPAVALQFDGDQDLLVLRHAANYGLGRYPRFTLEFWFKPTDQAANPDAPQLLFSQGDGEAGLAIYLEQQRLVAIAWCADFALTAVQETVLASEDGTVAANQWHHIAIVQDETQSLDYIEFRGFLDGIALGELSTTHANRSLSAGQRGYRLSPVGVAYLGGIDTSGMTRFQGAYLQPEKVGLLGFSGQISDLRLWDVARSAAAIAADRYRAPDLGTEGLIAYLPLDEGQEITVSDRVGRYSGQLRGQEAVLMAAPTVDPALQNRYSHYAPADQSGLDWRNYVFSGQLYVPDIPAGESSGGLGVTCLSRHPDGVDQFYRLQVTWAEGQPQFALVAHPQGVQPLTLEQADFPVASPGTWYNFRIQVIDATASSRTDLTITLWPEGKRKPRQPQVTAFDASPVRISRGTVGLWVAGNQPQTLAARFNHLQVVALTEAGQEGDTLLNASFKADLPGTHPAGWVDTGDRLMPQDAADLFVPLDLNGRTVLGTDSTLAGIHSHYAPADGSALTWSTYTYWGQLRLSDPDGGIGLTVLSRTPTGLDQYYALRREADHPSFRLVAHPLGVQPLTAAPDSSLDTGLVPRPDTDYAVLIEVDASGDRTQIRAKVWEAGTPEPAEFQAQGFDASSIRVRAGSVGIWAAGPGRKSFDDLKVLQETLLREDFSAYSAAQDPTGWLDTRANNSRREDADLFKTVRRDDQIGFGTQSRDRNIHSHYQPAAALTWSNYTYTGRMLITAEADGDFDGIGVTFLSRYTDPEAAPNRHNQYYRLRRLADSPSFHLAPHPQDQRQVNPAQSDSGVRPLANRWYRFLVEVNDTGSRTQIRAKVWLDGSPEPAQFQINSFDGNNSGDRDRTRLVAGTVGLWANHDGEKHFDDLQVRRGVYLSADLRRADWQTTGARTRFTPDDRLFAIERIPDHPTWQSVADLPLLRQPLNLSALQFDGSRQYLALAALQGEIGSRFSLEAWIQPATSDREAPILSWGNAWFGLNAAGQISLNTATASLTGTRALSSDGFSHVAVSVDGEAVTLYVNGAAAGNGNLTLPALQAGSQLEVGRADRLYYSGQIRDLRLWGLALTEFPVPQRYQRPDRQATDLLANWDFADLQGNYSLDSSAQANHLRLGGLESARKPTLVADNPARGGDFWSQPQTVLRFSRAVDGLDLPVAPEPVPPSRHTIELWVQVTDPQISHRKQVIYHYGDAQQGLVIYVHDGRLYVGGYDSSPNGSNWDGTWLSTDRLLPQHWHQIALVLDGRPELRPDQIQAYLDGQLLGLGAGARLSTALTARLGMATGPIRFHDGPATGQDSHLEGAVLSLRLWDTARTAAEITADRYTRLSGDQPDLALLWRFDGITPAQPEIPDRSGHRPPVALTDLTRLQPLTLAAAAPPAPVLNRETLLALADLRRLQQRHPQSVDQLTALWYDLRHSGRADGRVFFDRVFNATDGLTEVWGYHDPARRWDVTGQELPSRDRSLRSRLMAALQIADADLDRLVTQLSGDETVVEVDAFYLRQLYRLAQTPKLLRLTTAEYQVVLAMLGLSGINSLAELVLVSDRVAELNRIGVSVDELNFLANDISSDRLRPPYTDTDLRVFADDVVRQSPEFLVVPLTFVSPAISELQSATLVEWLQPTEPERTIAALTSRYFVDDLGAVTDRYQTPADLTDLALAQNWAAPFAALGNDAFTVLQRAGFLSAEGILLRPDDLDQFPSAFGDQPPGPTELAALQSALADQANRQTPIIELLERYRDQHRNAILAGLSEVLKADPEPLQAVITYLQTVGEPLSDPSRLLERLMALEETQPLPTDLLDYLDRLYKILFLVTRFDLTTREIQMLLTHPACFSVRDVFHPDLNDLVNLFSFTELKAAFGGDPDQLVQLLALDTDSAITEAILAISGWDRPQLLALTTHFGTDLAYNRVENLIRLQRGFALAAVLRVDIGLLLQLVATADLSLDVYRQQADALLPALRALYSDDQWPQVYRPLRDPLAIEKRDALLALALEQIPADFAGRRSPDLLSEFLLLDVQVGSEVDTSRIVQGTAALQQYVQRGLLNLEKGVNPATIPADQWNWMQNYRVWEANRKVFLYPESYIEPELRDTKTPLFADLEQELMQNDINVDTATQAFNNYLNKLAELADLKIIGTYLHRDIEELFTVQDNVSGLVAQLEQGFLQGLISPFAAVGAPLSNQVSVQGRSPLWRVLDSQGQVYTIRLSRDLGRLVVSRAGDSTLYLVGRSTTEPRSYYYRQWVNQTRWLPWQSIDLSFDTEFVTPVFAFNRLFLFWVEFTEISRRSGGSDGSSATLYQPTIRYSFPDFNGTWTTPQVYAEAGRELTLEERSRPQWQRVYALRTSFEVNRLSDNIVTQERERLLILYGDSIASGPGPSPAPIAVRTLRNARDQEMLQLQFQSQHQGLDVGLAPDALGTLFWYLGFMSTANLDRLSAIGNGNPDADRNGLRAVLNDLFDRPVAANPVVPETYQVVPQGENQWFIGFEDSRWLARQETIRLGDNNLSSRINVYNLSNRFLQSIVNLATSAPLTLPRYLGYMTTSNTSLLVALETGSASPQQSQLRAVLNALFDRPTDPPLTVPEQYTVQRQQPGQNRWRLTFGSTQLEVAEEHGRLNVYQLAADLSSGSWRYAGFITSQNPINLALEGNLAALRDLLSNLFDRAANGDLLSAPPLDLPQTYEIRSSGPNQWLTTFVNQQLVIQRENGRFNVYALNAPALEVEFGLDDQGRNRWLFTDPNRGEQVLIAPQPQNTLISIYRFTSAILHLSDQAEVNEYLSALTPVGLTVQADTSQVLWQQIPLSATLLDVNNQNGWYVLDTGEEQFLVRADVESLATDAERLVFPATGAANAFTFLADPLLQATASFQFDRIDTMAARELSVILFREGLDGLLSLTAQHTPEGDPSVYLPARGGQPLRLPTTRTIDFDGAYGLYYREIFFHIPFFIANQLNANQNFSDAQRWYHYIFNPTTPEAGGGGSGSNNDRYWQYQPFRNLDLESLAAILSNEEALAEYRDDPFDPHAIARLRINAYQKAIVMKYIDNLLDWGDNLFAQENRESINQALLLYVLAFNLLGPRPQARASRGFEEIGNYQGIREAFDATPEFLTDLDLNGNVAARTSTITLNRNGNIITTFCVPENADFIGFWDRVEDRLFKLRHSLSLEGIFRQLALFQPPLDVRDLVRAFASGNRDIGSLLSDLNRPVPHYRYSFMLERAREMIDNVKDFGAALLDALEKRDAEQLAMLQTTHERNLLDLITRSRELEIDEARGTLDALHTSRDNLQNRYDYFNTLIEGGTGVTSISPEERADLNLVADAQIIKSFTVVPAQIAAAITKSTPSTTTGVVGPNPVFELKTGGDEIGAALDGLSAVGQTVAEVLQTAAALTVKIGEYKRRRNGWVLERRTAELDLQAADQQIAITELQIQRAEQELRIHQRTIENNQQIADFYRRKFTNQALYNWLISRLSGLYFQAYKLAYDFARSAERALQYELPTNQRFINFGHWDSLRRGLLAGESLLLDVSRMQKFHLDNDSRFLEIEKTIPLSRVDATALVQLLANGQCDFTLSEALFNRDYPGHYFRVIKSIALSLKFAAGSPLADDPYLTINASLTQVSNKALLDPDINAVRYLMGVEGATQPNGSTLRVNLRSNQQIAVSSPRRDNGMFGSFDLNFVFDDRYFPFEGTGAVSTWHLEIPLDTNPALVQRVQTADVLAIEDVILHLQYTAKFDQGQFKQAVQAEVAQLP